MPQYVYKIVDNKSERVVYIGKTCNLKQRINTHLNNSSSIYNYCFNRDISVYYQEYETKSDVTIMEIYLLNKYNPIINFTNKFEDEPSFIINEKEWIYYKDINITRKRYLELLIKDAEAEIEKQYKLIKKLEEELKEWRNRNEKRIQTRSKN